MNSQSHLPVFRVDAFVAKGFLGNVACVMPLTEWLDDDQLLRIAADNGVPETAYTVKSGSEYQLRWFTPDIEMDLCGHATLAAGHIVLTELEPDSDFVAFSSVSGPLKVSRKDGKYAMRLPLRDPQPAELPDAIRDALNIQPLEVLKARDYVLVYDNQEDVTNIAIDRPVFRSNQPRDRRCNRDGTGNFLRLCIAVFHPPSDHPRGPRDRLRPLLPRPLLGQTHGPRPPARPATFGGRRRTPLLDPRRNGRNRGRGPNVTARPPRGELTPVRRVLLAWQHSSPPGRWPSLHFWSQP